MNKKQIVALKNLVSEIENQAIQFDSDHWPQFQKICVEWGNKVVPFLKQYENQQFNNELSKIGAPIHPSYLPSDLSGAPKEMAFNKMKRLAKQRLEELERGIEANDHNEGVVHLPSKVTIRWLYKLFCRLSIGSWILLGSIIIGLFGLGYKTARNGWYFPSGTSQTQQYKTLNSSSAPEIKLGLEETGVFEGNSVTTKDGHCTVHIISANDSSITLSAAIDANKPIEFFKRHPGDRVTVEADGRVYYIDLHGIRGNIVDLAIYAASGK